mgnify:FL=1
MEQYLNVQYVQQAVTDALHTLIQRMQTPDFFFQIVAIVASAIAATWVAPYANRLFKRMLVGTISGRWIIGLSDVLSRVMMALLWMIFLSLAAQAGHNVGLRMTLASAGVNLLTAWVVIRLLSYVVRNPFWSSVIFLSRSAPKTT